MPKGDKVYLTPADVEEQFSLSIRNQAVLRHKRQIQYRKLNGRVVYLLEWIEDYIERQTFPVVLTLTLSRKRKAVNA